MLRIAPGLQWSVPASGQLRATLEERSLSLPWRVLAIFSALESPKSLAQLVSELGKHATGTVDWVELTSLIKVLIEEGVLIGESRMELAARPTPQSREIEMHIELLNDEVRTRAYLDAIKANVRPGDVVVDLGTGNAILAMAAARAGAARVYAIEASAFADVAEQIIAANGLQDQVKVVRGWSNRVELPERADVLVSEIIGNDPLDEGVLRFMPDAVHRFLKPGGRILPNRLELEVQMHAINDEELSSHRIADHCLKRWKALYDFDYRPFAKHAEASGRRLYRSADQLRRWPVLSPIQSLLTVELGASLPGDNHCELEIESDPHPAAALVVRSKLWMPGGKEALLCAGHWRWPVQLLPSHPTVSHWHVEARWGALQGGLKLECKPRNVAESPSGAR